MYDLKALTIIDEDWGDDDRDFIIYLQIDIGETITDVPAELFTINVVSPIRLNRILEINNIEIGYGYFIMQDFNINIIKDKIQRLIKISYDKSHEKTILNLSKYLRNASV